MPVASVLEEFNDQGFIGPFRLGSAAEMAFLALQLGAVLSQSGPYSDDAQVNRHLDSPAVARLCTHPAIAEKAMAILGPDIVVWNSVFFVKGPGSPEVHWHQDLHFFKIDPPLTIAAWVAVERAHHEDACLRVIPRSHRSAVPHVPDPAAQFGEKVAPETVAGAEIRELEMEPGTFVLFDGRTIHGSPPGSTARRMALSVRLAPSSVMIDRSMLGPQGRVMPVPKPPVNVTEPASAAHARTSL